MSAIKPRIHYLDFMKGLCILMIVAYHITPQLQYLRRRQSHAHVV